MSNNYGLISACLALARLATFVGAQDVCYPRVTSATITQCVPNTGAPQPTPYGAGCPKPLISNAPLNGGPVTIAVPMPPCQSCGCATCVHANVYTTSFAAFCPEGITTQVYIVKELHTGMPAAPSITARPEVPLGFVKGAQTCSSCGPKPITTTLTYPADGCPFVSGQTGPAPAPGGVPSWVVAPQGGGAGYTPSKDGSGWSPAPGKPGDGGSWEVSQAGPQGGSQAGPQAGPQANPQANPQAGPQASPQANPKSAPQPAPQPGAQVGAAPGPPGQPSGIQAGAAAAPAPGGNGGAGSAGPAGSGDNGSGPGSNKTSGPQAPGPGGPGYQQVSVASIPTVATNLVVAFGFLAVSLIYVQ